MIAQPPPIPLRRLVVGQRIQLAVILLCGAIAAAVLFHFDPATTRFMPRCPFHELTGLQCPGCGALRAAHALLHGHFADAFAFNPLLILCLPALAVLLIRRESLTRQLRPHTIQAIALLLCIYWIARNLPVRPFTYLSP